jgi:hypothetical protein
VVGLCFPFPDLLAFAVVAGEAFDGVDVTLYRPNQPSNLIAGFATAFSCALPTIDFPSGFVGFEDRVFHFFPFP